MARILGKLRRHWAVASASAAPALLVLAVASAVMGYNFIAGGKGTTGCNYSLSSEKGTCNDCWKQATQFCTNQCNSPGGYCSRDADLFVPSGCEIIGSFGNCTSNCQSSCNN